MAAMGLLASQFSKRGNPERRLVMKFLATLALLTFSMKSASADEILVPATIIPNSEWVNSQATSVKCGKWANVPFHMEAIGSKARFTAHADVCGNFDEAQVIELLRFVKLADVAAQYNKPWRVSIWGTSQAVAINFNVINSCNEEAEWLLGKKFGRWANWEPLLAMRLCPRDFQPEWIPQVVE